MAYWKINNVALRGVTGTVPNRAVKTTDLPYFTKAEADTFDATVGIKNRYIASDDVCASDLCLDAAERLIYGLGWEKESIDVLLFASVTGDYKTPPTSAILQDRLGLSSSTFVLDVPMGCCGCMYGINVAGNMLSAGTARRAIVLVGDTAMRMGNSNDKSRGPLFGDCGTAFALEYDTSANEIIIDFNTLGAGYQALMTPHGGYRHPITSESFVEEDFGNGIIRAPKDALINGMDVFSFAITKPPISVKKMLDEQKLDKDNDVDFFLIHQANKLIVDRLVKKLKLPTEKVPYNLQKFGNLGGASIPMLMVSEIADDLRTRPLTLVCSSFGLGLTWGTMLLRTKEMIVLPINKK
ncbi:MAG: ketoacyl-ACP synthase III [Paludibacteraceae bacterium]|nr:ketoacyl-ACP synthase III [Paludibacteraceae bacterium]